MTDKKMLKDVRSAGCWSVGLYTGLIMNEWERLESNREYKKEFIKQIYDEEGRGSEIGGTTTRVKCGHTNHQAT